MGSPPRLWGKLPPTPVNNSELWFTPTPVGKTLCFNYNILKRVVHPHACGENILFSTHDSSRSGSPPRLWGKLRGAYWRTRNARFTPTPVGKTTPCSTALQGAMVHPHACGENSSGFFRAKRYNGSPPRLWGKRLEHLSSNPLERFTPTPVGKTAACREVYRQKAVHSHACGEN